MNNHLRMKELPISERPYEKLEKQGAQNLTDAELLAIIIKNGTRSDTALSLAQKVLLDGQERFENIIDLSLQDLMKIKGIGRVKAIQIKSVLELGKRIVNAKKQNKHYIKSPQDVLNILMNEMRFLKKEHVKCLLLTSKNELIKIVDVSIGSINSSIVHPREVFCEAVKCSSAGIILVHNHPSGDPSPSREDITITNRIYEAGKIIGIELLDHIIIGDKEFISMKEKIIF